MLLVLLLGITENRILYILYSVFNFLVYKENNTACYGPRDCQYDDTVITGTHAGRGDVPVTRSGSQSRNEPGPGPGASGADRSELPSSFPVCSSVGIGEKSNCASVRENGKGSPTHLAAAAQHPAPGPARGTWAPRARGMHGAFIF